MTQRNPGPLKGRFANITCARYTGENLIFCAEDQMAMSCDRAAGTLGRARLNKPQLNQSHATARSATERFLVAHTRRTHWHSPVPGRKGRQTPVRCGHLSVRAAHPHRQCRLYPSEGTGVWRHRAFGPIGPVSFKSLHNTCTRTLCRQIRRQIFVHDRHGPRIRPRLLHR